MADNDSKSGGGLLSRLKKAFSGKGKKDAMSEAERKEAMQKAFNSVKDDIACIKAFEKPAPKPAAPANWNTSDATVAADPTQAVKKPTAPANSNDPQTAAGSTAKNFLESLQTAQPSKPTQQPKPTMPDGVKPREILDAMLAESKANKAAIAKKADDVAISAQAAADNVSREKQAAAEKAGDQATEGVKNDKVSGGAFSGVHEVTRKHTSFGGSLCNGRLLEIENVDMNLLGIIKQHAIVPYFAAEQMETCTEKIQGIYRINGFQVMVKAAREIQINGKTCIICIVRTPVVEKIELGSMTDEQQVTADTVMSLVEEEKSKKR